MVRINRNYTLEESNGQTELIVDIGIDNSLDYLRNLAKSYGKTENNG